MSEARAFETSSVYWFRKGLTGIVSVPGFILIASFVGFGGLAREGGWSVGEAALMTGAIWALPTQVVFVGAVAAGTSLGAVAVAVTLSAVRLLPMTVALMPVLRDPAKPSWIYYASSHFVAVTAWVVSMKRLPEIPRHNRLAFFLGFGMGLTVCNIVVTILSFQVAGSVPPLVGAALFFLTPVYFLLALWSAARVRVDAFALVFGLVLGPVFHAIDPEFDILWAGALGGTLAFCLHRLTARG